MNESDPCPAPTVPTDILSTADQIEQELFAACVFVEPSMQEAVGTLDTVAFSYPQSGRAAGAATWRRSMNELAFAFVLRALNLEGERVRVLWDQNPPLWRGDRLIPGSRGYGNNPDNIYRRIPINESGRYVVRGRRRDPRPTDLSVSVLPNFTIEHGWKPATLDVGTLETDADGWFEVTLDSSPGDGSPNHMQLASKAERLTIRDSMSDWAREIPMQLEVTRTDRGEARHSSFDPGAAAARLASRLHEYIHHHMKLTSRFIYMREPNSLVTPMAGPSGGLSTQILSNGNFYLEDDEAVVVDADPLGARYLAIQLWDPWFFALEYRTRTGSLNMNQAVADGDGRYRFVISKHDPGVHNWLDTDGMSEGGVALRWQAVPNGSIAGDATLFVNRMPISQLKARLPADTEWITSAKRQAQLSARRIAHDRRFGL